MRHLPTYLLTATLCVSVSCDDADTHDRDPDHGPPPIDRGPDISTDQGTLDSGQDSAILDVTPPDVLLVDAKPNDIRPVAVDASPSDTGLVAPSDVAPSDMAPNDLSVSPSDLGLECVEDDQRPCENACDGSLQHCLDGQWGPCTSPSELCDGLDNDCDGKFDETFDVGQPCNLVVDGCQLPGQLICRDNDAVCDPVEANIFEECNGIDDDCDGRIDEDFGIGQPCLVVVGMCMAPGSLVCDNLGAPRCQELPDVEQCNGLDDDCDGEIDEDEPCFEGLGECLRVGRQRCDGGFRICNEVLGESFPEECDGLDNDCDGRTDEQGICN